MFIPVEWYEKIMGVQINKFYLISIRNNNKILQHRKNKKIKQQLQTINYYITNILQIALKLFVAFLQQIIIGRTPMFLQDTKLLKNKKKNKTEQRIEQYDNRVRRILADTKSQSKISKFNDQKIRDQMDMSSQDLVKVKLQEKLLKNRKIFGKGIRWRQKGANAQNQKKHSAIKSHGNLHQKQVIMERAAEHRRVNSSFKISDKLKTMTSMFRNPERPERPDRVKTDHVSDEYQEDFENPFKILQYSQSKHKKKISKLDDLLNQEELQNSKQIIKEVQEMRKTSKLRPNPKQWQFHNCLALQKIELYQTNLKISCEGWTVLDRLQLKYLRGWHPKKQQDFSPALRFFIFLICFTLHNQELLDIDELYVRVNPKHVTYVTSEITLQGNSIMSLRKLITVLIITQHQDLMIHCILAVGHILELCAEGPIEKGHQVFVKKTDKSTTENYCELLEQKCKQYCQSLQLAQTRIVVGKNCLKKPTYPSFMQYFVTSTPLDICLLFMKCLNFQEFRQILCIRVYEPDYRFQVGWNFWEGRKGHWVNQEYSKYRLKGIKGRTLNKNECVIAWDQKREIVLAMADCKVNMHWKDMERVQIWIDSHIPRFSNKYSLHMTSYPTDTQRFYRIN